MWKWAEAIGSGTADPIQGPAAATPIPPPVIPNKPAPGQRGPVGLAPRTTYSRVNTGSPPTPDAGATAQKSAPPLPPKVAQMNDRIMTRPTMQDLMKQAMAGTISKVDITAEASRQLLGQSEEPSEKTASDNTTTDHIPTAHLEKLADVIGYLAGHFEKAASETTHDLGPGKGPGALQVLEATSSENNIDAGQQGESTTKNQPPKNPSLQGEQVQVGKANTGLETNDSMKHGPQPVEPIKNEKGPIGPSEGDKTVTASATDLFNRNLARITKIAADDKCSKCGDKKCSCSTEEKKAAADFAASIRKTAQQAKVAEDAINPAKISAGAAVPPAASASESAVPGEPSDVSKQKALISSNEAAINYTKGQAKADPKHDVAQVVTEPPLSSAHDKTLNEAFDNTSRAGVKISSAQSVAGGVLKTAAARALLTKLAEKVSGDKKDENKKEKASGVEPSPAGHSGFSAASMNPN